MLWAQLNQDINRREYKAFIIIVQGGNTMYRYKYTKCTKSPLPPPFITLTYYYIIVKEKNSSVLIVQ